MDGVAMEMHAEAFSNTLSLIPRSVPHTLCLGLCYRNLTTCPVSPRCPCPLNQTMGNIDSKRKEKESGLPQLSPMSAAHLTVTSLQRQHSANYLTCVVANLWALERPLTPLFRCLFLDISLFPEIPSVLPPPLNFLKFILSSKHSEMLLYFVVGAQLAYVKLLFHYEIKKNEQC